MKKIWTDQAWEDYLYWQATNRKMLKRINLLIRDIERNGYRGLGKPEPLKGELTGLWSVRIDDKNRIVFRIKGENIEIWQCRSHYGE